MQWFRMYSEAVDDEKLRLLAFEDRWHFVALLCCKSTGILDGEDAALRRRKVAVKLGLDLRELDEVARRLEEVGLICAETFQPIAWDSRQFQSDSAAERMRAYRERTKEKAKRNCDVTVTAQETETDTDTEAEKRKRRGSRFTLTQLPAEWAEFCKKARPDLDPDACFAKFGDYWGSVPGRHGVKLDWLKTWRNFVRTERAAPAWARPTKTPEEVAAEAMRMMEERDAKARAA